MDDDFQRLIAHKNPLIESLPSQCRSRHGFLISSFIFNCFGCKLLFQLLVSVTHVKIVLKLSTQSSEVGVLFHWNLNSLPSLVQVVDLDLLLCTGFNLERADLFQCQIFTRRLMNG